MTPDCGHVAGCHRGGTGEEHVAWAVSLLSVAVRLATPFGHTKKKKKKKRMLIHVSKEF